MIGKKERVNVLILVKTIPTESRKYREVVCTAGITDKGNWIRIYPIEFRLLEKDVQFKKYQWISIDIDDAQSGDKRPESHKCDVSSIEIGAQIGTDNY